MTADDFPSFTAWDVTHCCVCGETIPPVTELSLCDECHEMSPEGQ